MPPNYPFVYIGRSSAGDDSKPVYVLHYAVEAFDYNVTGPSSANYEAVLKSGERIPFVPIDNDITKVISEMTNALNFRP